MLLSRKDRDSLRTLRTDLKLLTLTNKKSAEKPVIADVLQWLEKIVAEAQRTQNR